MRAVFRPAQCSHRGYASMFSTVSALSWGLCEHFSARKPRRRSDFVYFSAWKPTPSSDFVYFYAWKPAPSSDFVYFSTWKPRRPPPCGALFRLETSSPPPGEHFSALHGAPCGVHGGHFCLARCSMWGTWRAFLPCAVLHVGYMERFSGRRGAPCGVYGGHFRPARCSHRGYVSTFPGGALPEWSQAEGAPSCDVTHYPYICLLLLPLLCLTRVRLCCGDGIHY